VNRLNGLACYLSGPIDFAENYGSAWRDDITPFIEEKNVKVFNPLKPMFYGSANLNEYKRPHMLELVKQRRFEELRADMKDLNTWDLRAIRHML
jgi:hypothetical protein